MSAPLGTAILVAGARQHTLKRARINDLLVITDLELFRAPFGTKWHKLGSGQAEPELIDLSGALEAATPLLSRTALNALHADLAVITTLHFGRWTFPVSGHSGPLTVSPTLAGYRVQLSLIRNGAASVS